MRVLPRVCGLKNERVRRAIDTLSLPIILDIGKVFTSHCEILHNGRRAHALFPPDDKDKVLCRGESTPIHSATYSATTPAPKSPYIYHPLREGFSGETRLVNLPVICLYRLQLKQQPGKYVFSGDRQVGGHARRGEGAVSGDCFHFHLMLAW